MRGNLAGETGHRDGAVGVGLADVADRGELGAGEVSGERQDGRGHALPVAEPLGDEGDDLRLPWGQALRLARPPAVLVGVGLLLRHWLEAVAATSRGTSSENTSGLIADHGVSASFETVTKSGP